MKNKLIALLLLIVTLSFSLTSCGKGDFAYGFEISEVDEDGLTGEIINAEDYLGKIMIINFWGVWCPYCLNEMPDLVEIAEDYDGRVKVIAVHSDWKFEECADYIADNFANSKILFGKDEPTLNGNDAYYSLLGGANSYPYTVIINSDGEISETIEGMTDYLGFQLAINRASK